MPPALPPTRLSGELKPWPDLRSPMEPNRRPSPDEGETLRSSRNCPSIAPHSKEVFSSTYETSP